MRMTQPLIQDDFVTVAPTLAYLDYNPRFLQVRHDSLYAALCDSDSLRHFAQTQVGRFRKAKQDSGMIGEKSPGRAGHTEIVTAYGRAVNAPLCVLHPLCRSLDFLTPQAMSACLPVQSDISACLPKKRRQPLRLSRGYERVPMPRADKNALSGQLGQCLRDKRNHRVQQDNGLQDIGMEQKQRGGNVGTVREADRCDLPGLKTVTYGGHCDELRQFFRPLKEIGNVKDAFRQAAEETRHPIFQNHAARAEKICGGVQHFPQRQQIVFVTASSVQKQQSFGGVRRRNPAVNKMKEAVRHSK